MKHTGKITLSLLLALFLVASAAFVQSSDLFFQIKKQLTIFSDVYKEVATQYVDEIGPEELMTRSIDAMLEGLDPYTEFIDEGEQQQIEILSSGSYGGIGIEAGYRGDEIVIIAPMEGYPGQRAGLRAGDIIEEINGTNVQGMSPEEVQRLTVGDVGTSVSIKIRRPGIDEGITFDLERERIEVKNINYSDFLGDDKEFGYIQLTRFGQQAAEEVRQELLKMKDAENFNGLILDLRNNPGGLLNEAVKLIDKFVEPGVTVVETRGRLDDHNSTMVTSEPALFEDLPLIILINNGSASASEIVAGALQDLDRAVVIGENSFGKGLVQTIRPLSYNTSLKITISRYYIPSGRSIQSMDYSGYDSGRDQLVPDSLRRAFNTKNGRLVFDGHGIEPDIHVQEQGSSLIDLALQRNNNYFFFISDLIAGENQSGEPEIPDNLFSQFASYLVEKDFTFETPADRHIEALEQHIENFSKESSASENLDELKALLRDYKISQIYDNQEIIEKNLRIEWISQTMGAQQRNSSMLEMDEFIIRAIDILEDSHQYQIVLRP
jgi:carboxyl-terminal processing protease